MFQGMWLISLHFDVTPLPCFIMYNHFSESGGGVCSHVFVCAWICVCDPQVIGWFACVDHDIMIREYSGYH